MGTEVWRWQGGTSGNDGLLGATVGLTGSCSLAGYTLDSVSTTSSVFGEWIVVTLDSDGILQGQLQGDITGYTPTSAAFGADGSVVIVGNSEDEPPNAYAAKLDEYGTFLWQWKETSTTGTSVYDVVVAGDGSVIMAGSQSTTEWVDLDGFGDFAGWKLNADGELVWKWEHDTGGYDILQTAVVGDDDSVVLAGYTYGNWSGVNSGGDAGDFAAVKLDADGLELWRWQDGTATYGTLTASVMEIDGSIMLAGITGGTWGGAYSNVGGEYDFAAVKLDANGDEVWRWQDGTVGEDVIFHAAAGDDGSFVLAGWTNGTWDEPSDDSFDFAAVKLDADGTEIWRYQGGSTDAELDKAVVITAGFNGEMLLAGPTTGSWGAGTVGGFDLSALMLDTGAAPTPSPTLAVPSGTDSLTPAPSATVLSPTRSPTFRLVPSPPTGASPTRTSPAPASPALPSQGLTSPAPTRVVETIVDTPGPGSASPAPVVAAQSSGSVFSSTNIGLVSAAATLALIVAGVCLRKKQNANNSAKVHRAALSTGVTPSNEFDVQRHAVPPLTSGDARGSTDPPPPPYVQSIDPPAYDQGLCDTYVQSTDPPAYTQDVYDTRTMTADSRSLTTSAPGTDQLRGINQPPPAFDNNAAAVADAPPVDARADDAATASMGRASGIGSSASSGGSEVGKAVVEAARNLAMQSQFPGVSEAATLVSILVNLVLDDQSHTAEMESRVKRCRIVILILERAAMVLGQGNGANGEMERMLIEDVQTAVRDMVELIKTYRSKKRISQVIVSTMFKRRMDETEAVIDRAISDLKLGLHVHAAVNDQKDRQNAGEHWRGFQRLIRGRKGHGKDTTDGVHQRKAAEAKAVASARRLRRQRNLNQIEIPEDDVTISEEVLGKGGFGTVYIADYNGRNAAAKVMKIDQEHRVIGGHNDGHSRRRVNEDVANKQRASLLLELQAMLRLRSPHTVNVYGAITSRKDRLVLLMELLTGGDLRSFLRHAKGRLPEARTRQIIVDVGAGMAFLHRKKAVHGDLKSANILLDGDGRAKIGDFGTSRWAQHSDSTGLATYKTNAGDTMKMMSFAWAAPEVLDAKGSTYASDVYSFGIVAWEVLSRQLPWAEEALPRDIYRRVVFKGDRPTIPADTPDDIADIVRACWEGTPRKRPPASQIVGRLRYSQLLEEE